MHRMRAQQLVHPPVDTFGMSLSPDGQMVLELQNDDATRVGRCPAIDLERMAASRGLCCATRYLARVIEASVIVKGYQTLLDHSG
jgi:hypothetical protein